MSAGFGGGTGTAELETRNFGARTSWALCMFLRGSALGMDFKVRFSGFLDGAACPTRLGFEPGLLVTLSFRGLPQNILLSRSGAAALLDFP